LLRSWLGQREKVDGDSRLSNMAARLKVVILASGSGSIAQSVIEAKESGLLDIEILALISDKKCLALERAGKHQIPARYLPLDGDRDQWSARLLAEVGAFAPDLVLSLGFMKILDRSFLEKFRVINTHPSYLPHFPGAHAVKEALESGALETGCSIHWVDEGVDTGEIIAQRKIAILPGDSEETLHQRIKIQERDLIIEVLQKIIDKS
jgi:phosphoribosylglycinamide formyltransferase-1